jgi:transposase InsO family protein
VALTADITALALQYSRCGYRRITALLHRAGWIVNVKRVERIWRREGLKVRHRQPKRGRLLLNDSSCIRLRPEYPNHVWSYDFADDRAHNRRKIRMLNVIDECTRECIAIRVEGKLNVIDVIDVLPDLFILKGNPTHIRSDNGPEFIAKALREWIAAVGAKTAYIMPGSPHALTFQTDHSTGAGHAPKTPYPPVTEFSLHQSFSKGRIGRAAQICPPENQISITGQPNVELVA